jgi:hypothetical protein
MFRRWTLVPAIAAVAALAASMGGTAAAAPVTIGSTSGTPSGNICAAMMKCSYLPNLPSPLQVPSNGTITSFSVNAGSAGGTVWLRVVHFSAGVIQSVATSSPQTLATGVKTFNVSMPVQGGDQLALDNDSSALMFDTSNASANTVYYSPALPNGPPTTPGVGRSGYRLLLSATLQPGCQDPTSAYNQGFNSGFNPGYKSGFNTSFRSAYTANGSWQLGWKSGFETARHSTHTARESTQAAPPVASTKARAAALPAGCDSEFNQGFNAGFNPGFKSGFNSGFNVAFNNGFKAGLAAGGRHK